MNQLHDHLAQIEIEIERAESHLVKLDQWLKRIEAAGMYCVIPTEEWKDGRYLYMRFPPGNELDGLDKKGRLYIGSKPDRIIEARRLANNRAIYETLQVTIEQLRQWLKEQEAAIKWQVHKTERWPRYYGEFSSDFLGGVVAGQGGQGYRELSE